MVSSISSSQVMDLAELRARRMIAQLLAPSAAHPLGSHCGSSPSCSPLEQIHAVTRWMTASQAQFRDSGLQAISIRARQPYELVREAVAQGTIVRSWSQRGTHHLLAAEDVRWVTRLCSPRVQRDSAQRQPGLGFQPGQVDAARDALLAHLSTLEPHQGAARTDCYEVFRSAGVDPEKGRGSHLLRHFGGEGDIVQGPPVGSTQNEDTFLLHDKLPHAPLELSDDEALHTLAARYISARGPVTPQDFAWWAGITVRDAKRGFNLALSSGEVQSCEVAHASPSQPGPTQPLKPSTMYLGSWQAGEIIARDS